MAFKQLYLLKVSVRVEMLVTYLQSLVSKKINDQTIRGYRGGYLPSERRTIEKGLRDGDYSNGC